MSQRTIHVVGGGLAGCEAALQLARLGIPITLHEMRPRSSTPVHQSGDLAEIVCSNSFKSMDHATPSGLLKLELERLGCLLLAVARSTAVPAGAALAVDRDRFARAVTQLVIRQPSISLVREEVTHLDLSSDDYWLLATGPLTAHPLQTQIQELTGREGLHFFDAIAPSVTKESLDLQVLFRAARYGKGEADYLNAPMDEPTYQAFHQALVSADKVAVPDFDRAQLFAGCQPIEEIAASGTDSLVFGPLRPVGLVDPATGRRSHAVVQLRQENQAGSLYGLVGFQTRLKYGEQKRVFRMIPGLHKAEFVRLGQMHRNFYLDTPRSLNRQFALHVDPRVRIAGQITGVEGYMESICSGLVTSWQLAAELRGIDLPPWPSHSMIGALLFGFLFDTTSRRFAPMNVNYGLIPPLSTRIKGRRERKLALTARAMEDLETYLSCPELRRLLAASSDG